MCDWECVTESGCQSWRVTGRGRSCADCGTGLLQAEVEKKTPSVTGARKSAAKGIAAKGRHGKAAAQKAGSAATNGADAPKKKGGFLQALGIGQESAYADEES